MDGYERFTLDELAELHARALWECGEREGGSLYGAFLRVAAALDAAHALLYREQAEKGADDLTAGLKKRLGPGGATAASRTPAVAFRVRPKTSRRTCKDCGGIMWKTQLGWECNRGHQEE